MCVYFWVKKGRILDMLRRLRRQDLDSDWTWGLKESSESRTTPRTLACGDWLMVVPSILPKIRGRGTWGRKNDKFGFGKIEFEEVV